MIWRDPVCDFIEGASDSFEDHEIYAYSRQDSYGYI